MFNLGPMEVLVVVVVALVVLGPQRLPEAMQQLGRGVGELRRWSTRLTAEVQSAFVPGAGPAPAAERAVSVVERAVSVVEGEVSVVTREASVVEGAAS